MYYQRFNRLTGMTVGFFCMAFFLLHCLGDVGGEGNEDDEDRQTNVIFNFKSYDSQPYDPAALGNDPNRNELTVFFEYINGASPSGRSLDFCFAEQTDDHQRIIEEKDLINRLSKTLEPNETQITLPLTQNRTYWVGVALHPENSKDVCKRLYDGTSFLDGSIPINMTEEKRILIQIDVQNNTTIFFDNLPDDYPNQIDNLDSAISPHPSTTPGSTANVHGILMLKYKSFFIFTRTKPLANESVLLFDSQAMQLEFINNFKDHYRNKNAPQRAMAEATTNDQGQYQLTIDLDHREPLTKKYSMLVVYPFGNTYRGACIRFTKSLLSTNKSTDLGTFVIDNKDIISLGLKTYAASEITCLDLFPVLQSP